jgi:hypothetical protein
MDMNRLPVDPTWQERIRIDPGYLTETLASLSIIPIQLGLMWTDMMKRQGRYGIRGPTVSATRASSEGWPGAAGGPP